VRSARSLAKPRLGSNPTWPRPPLRRREFNVREILLEHGANMISDLRTVGDVDSDLMATTGDARKLDLADCSVTGIVTSPPYMSRIDYIRATQPELAALGMHDSTAALRSTVMGGVISRQPPATPASVPAVDGILKRIRTHDSKASATYYAALAEIYFADLTSSIKELGRVLVSGGVAIVVVQTSYYKSILVPLPQIVCAIARLMGIKVAVHQSEAVVNHFGQLSPHQRSYAGTKRLAESVVLLTKP